MTLEEQRACMEPLQLAGQLIMENGGETFRAEETVTRMGRAFGLRDVESFAVPSGLFISYSLEDGTTESSVKRVRGGETDLTRVDQVNQVSRKTECDGLEPEKALRELQAVRGQKSSPALAVIGAAVCAGGFSLMFGGGWIDFAIAFLLAGLIQLLGMLLNRLQIQSLLSVLMGSILAALIPAVLARITGGLNTEAIVAGTLMPMLPGLMMTNAIQDSMRGDMVSGLSHGAQAVLIACLVAGGALVAESVFRFLAGGGV